ncbi:MAG: beta strand repeat-containing protein, partial [Desulfuromonadaceae bacterium]
GNSLASTNYSLSLTGNGFATYTEDNTVRIMQRTTGSQAWTLTGTHDISGYITPTAQRNSLNIFGEFAHGALRVCNLTATKSSTNTSCGNSNGTITVSNPSGATNYEYRLDAGTWQTDGNFIGLASGTYSVQMRDADATGCISTLGNQVVSQPASLTLSSSVVDVSCYANGSINITAGGGTAPYTYDWTDIPGTNNAEDRAGVLAGSYFVTVTDVNGCNLSSGAIVVAAATGCTGMDVCKSDAAKVFSVTPDPDVTSYTWSVPSGAVIVSGQGTPSVTVNWNAVALGSYQVGVKSNNTCGTSTETFQTVYINAPTATASVIGGACLGASLQLSAGGGQTYTWTGPNSFTSSSVNPVVYNAASPTNEGTYHVTVTDNKGCSATASVAVTLNTPPTESSVISPAACGSSTGAINITPSVGTSFTYLWNTGVTTQDISSISSGNYSVIITNNFGCSVVGNYIVSNTGGPTALVAQTNVLCNGSSTGDITLTVSGGTPGVDPEPLYTYLWSNGSVDQDLTGLAAGTYSVIITDGAGCTGAASAIITQPNALQLDNILTHINCNGASTGAINITVTGGTGAYSYDWGGGITSEDRSAIPAGTYSVTVTDASLCTVSGTFTITQPAAALDANTTVTDIDCNGNADGIVTLTVTGGTQPYTYVWTRTEAGYAGATTKDITGLSPGTYNVTVTDSKGCIVETSGIVTQPAVLSLSKTLTHVSCRNGSNGAINLSVSGGTTSYTYSWNNGAISEDLSGLTAGTYSVMVTDANGCTASTTATITEPAAVLSASITGQANVLCNAGAAGTATAAGVGGTSPYTYSWNSSPVQTTSTATGLNAGLYTVVITDANLCTATNSVTITQPSAISISGLVTNVLCNSASTGTINITATGGTGSYTYNWGGGITAEDRTGLTAGSYNVTVTDANNCTTSAGFTITQPAVAITPTMVNSNITCKNAHNGSINLSVTGGVSPYTYLWTGGATTEDITNLAPGIYSVTVTDANLCTATLSSFAITEPASVLSVIATPTAVTCKNGTNGSITASPGGGTAPYTYSWSTGATTATISGLGAGTYELTTTDQNGCTATTSAVVTQPTTQIELFATTTESSSCGTATGSINLTVTNGNAPYTYSWTNTLQTVQDPTGLGANTYTVTVTDNTGCTESLPVTVGTAPAMNVSVTTFPKTCISTDGSAYAIVSGGVAPYTYLWNGGATSQDITNLNTGTYTVTVTDANGCTATNSGTVGSISCMPPVVVDDIFNTNYNTLLNGDVSVNDSDPDGISSTLEFFNETFPTAEQGTLVWGTSYDGTFTFMPTLGYAG